MDYFVLRPGAPYKGLQLVTIANGSMRPAKLRYANGNASTPACWILVETALLESEKETVRKMNLFSTGVGNNWKCGISRFCLQCIESPNLRFRILVRNSSRCDGYLKLPARKDSIVIPLTNMENQHILLAEERDRISEILNTSEHWYREGLNPFAPAAQPVQAQPRPVLQAPQAPQAQPRPVLQTPQAPQPLSAYIANTLVQHAKIQPDAQCPITYEPLTECTKFCVGNCGHVYSDAVATMQTCPLCTQRVTWTAVEIAA